MKSPLLLVFLLPGLAGAAAMDIPLAVTGLAHPSLKQTPTLDELKLSDEYLKSGLELLKKSDKADRAVEDFKDSVRLAPRAENYKALGTAYYQQGKKVKAAWAYRQSLQLFPDKQVQALVDALEGKDHPEDRFRDNYDKTRFEALIEAGAKAEKAGKEDRALDSYVEAWSIKPDPGAAGPALRLAADMAEEEMAAKSVARAIRVMAKVDALKGTADLSNESKKVISRLNALEDSVVRYTGQKLREHEKAMLSDREAWERGVAETVAKKVRDVNLNAPAPGR